MMQVFLVSFQLYAPLSGFVCTTNFLLRSCLCPCSNMQPICSVSPLPLRMSPFLSVKILLCSYVQSRTYNRTIFLYSSFISLFWGRCTLLRNNGIYKTSPVDTVSFQMGEVAIRRTDHFDVAIIIHFWNKWTFQQLWKSNYV